MEDDRFDPSALTALVLDETWDAGALHEFKVVVAGTRTGGVNRDDVDAHYSRALELSHGRSAGLFVAYAETVALPAQDKRRFRDLLERALAIDPMPDFAYRNEQWVCAPVATDTRGNAAYNVQALEAGYLTDKQRERIVPDLWRRQAAICYASLGPLGGGETVYLFEQRDGELLVFLDEAAFRAAVAADQRERG